MARFIMSAAQWSVFFRPRRNYKLWLCGGGCCQGASPGRTNKIAADKSSIFPLSAKRDPCQTSLAPLVISRTRAQYHLVIVSFRPEIFREAISECPLFWSDSSADEDESNLFDACERN